MSDIRILHISPHLGGGVGSVLQAYFSHEAHVKQHRHTVVSLDKVSESTKQWCASINVPCIAQCSPETLCQHVANADIVLIHWWNHPLLYNLLLSYKLPPCRLVFWSHISGFDAPYVFVPELFSYADAFVFTTPLSLRTSVVQALSPQEQKKLHTIWATSGVEHLRNVQPIEHKGFTAGYIGTVDYAKLHPDFWKVCEQTDIDLLHFYFCGGPCHEQLQNEARQRGLDHKVTFVGPVTDIQTWLARFDIFFYPLAEYHYGTCDQVIAEAMAAGVPPLVLGNPMERLMVDHGKTGLIANGIEDAIHLLTQYSKDTALQKRLAASAKEYAHSRYLVSTMAAQWQTVFHEVLQQEKRHHVWTRYHTAHIPLSPATLFVESLGEEGEVFRAFLNASGTAECNQRLSPIQNLAQNTRWQSDSKGTVHQYALFFPNDPVLALWSNAMKQQEMNSFAELEKFKAESASRVATYATNTSLSSATQAFASEICKVDYAYNFFWCGVPILQLSTDLQAMQEVIWQSRPDCIIETGVAWGGSLVFSASMLSILEVCGYVSDPLVIGIDIDIRPHNKTNILNHPLAKKIALVEGSSIAPEVINRVKQLAHGKKNIMVCLDSNHTHDHVLAELYAYTPLIGIGSYCIVGDTGIEDVPQATKSNRPWGPGNSPKSAVRMFLQESSDFVVDRHIETKLLLTGSSEGYLKRIK